MKIIIAYHTGSGHTKKLASHIAEGVASQPGCNVELLNVAQLDNKSLQSLHDADAIIFGSPTYMGSASGPFKSFMDQTGDFWLEQKWANKIAAGFTVSTGPSGDKLNTLIQLSVFAAQHNMIWINLGLVGSLYTKDGQGLNASASWLGLGAIASRDKTELITSQDAETARTFGKRIAEATIRWNKRGGQ